MYSPRLRDLLGDNDQNGLLIDLGNDDYYGTGAVDDPRPAAARAATTAASPATWDQRTMATRSPALAPRSVGQHANRRRRAASDRPCCRPRLALLHGADGAAPEANKLFVVLRGLILVAETRRVRRRGA
jgi:hypothetical protein